MPNHFASIGFSVGSPAELEQLVSGLHARNLPTPIGGAYLYYNTPEGCELWSQLDPDGRLVGCNPHFSGRSRYQVHVGQVESVGGTPLDGQLRGRLGEEELAVPIVIDVPDFRLSVARLQLPVQATLQVAAFPHELGVFSNEEAFRRSPMGELSPDGALIPSGTFEPGGGAIEPPRPVAIFAGRIQSVRYLTNSQTGRPFYGLEVRTLGGTVDVVATPEQAGGQPQVNGIVAGSFHLSGRLIEPLSADHPPTQLEPTVPALPGSRRDDLVSRIRQAYLAWLRSPDGERHWRRIHPPPRWRYVLAALCAISVAGIPIAIGLLLSAWSDSRRRRRTWDDHVQRVQRMVPVATFPIMVNRMLLEKPGVLAPGLVMGSPDPQAADANLMMSIVHQIQQVESAGPKDEHEKELLTLLMDERYTPNRRRRLPSRFTGGSDVYAFDLMIVSDFLPQRRLELPLYCLADPGPEGEIHMIPHAVIQAASQARTQTDER